MAKSGIDYFPLDVTLDSKFELIEAEYGLTGFGVIVHLLQEIYGKAGYYIEWTNEVALLFAKKVGLGGSVVSEIVEASIRRGMFDKEIYDKYRVLTSTGIQKRYFEAVSRRKILKVDYNILLVDAAQILNNVDIRAENVNILSKNADISKQSKVEKSRVKESRVKKSKESANALSYSARETEFEKFWAAYPKKTYKADAKSAYLEIPYADIKNILAAVEKAKQTPEWQEQRGRFVPTAAKWLKNRCWEDELPDNGVEQHRESLSGDELENLKAIYAKVKGETT